MAADQSKNSGPPFDLETVRLLAELMGQHDLSEIELENGEERVRLRRGPHGAVAAMPMPAAPAPANAAPSTPAGSAASHLVPIKSEAIGTFYSRSKPDIDPYVKVGAKVTPTTVVGLIEAMKLFNEVQAGCSGVVAEICVENQQAVEYGTVLFKVDPIG